MISVELNINLLANSLKEKRKNDGLNKAQLAEKIDLHEITISRIEREMNAEVDARTLCIVSRYVKSSMESFFIIKY